MLGARDRPGHDEAVTRALDEHTSPARILDDVVWRHRTTKVAPKTVNQKRYVDSIRHNTITFGIGPAGTGKTFLAVALAAAALSRREVNRIILTRPAVEAGERLGFLPGDLMAKVDPYLRPLFDALHDMLEPDKVAQHLDRGVIEVAPLAFMRGRTLNDSFIILDEAQNTSPEQMKMFLTRLGFGSKMVVTGDITQIDLPREQRFGARGRGGHPRARSRAIQFVPLRRGGRRPPQAGPAHRRGLRRARATVGARAPPAHPSPSPRGVSGLEVEIVGGRAGDVEQLKRLCTEALARVGVTDGHLAIVFVDEERIRELNRRHRGVDRPTDVLSFGIDEAGPTAGPRELGDIVICPSRTEDTGEAVVHGALHLAGMDHEADSGEMLALQSEVIRTHRP